LTHFKILQIIQTISLGFVYSFLSWAMPWANFQLTVSSFEFEQKSSSRLCLWPYFIWWWEIWIPIVTVTCWTKLQEQFDAISLSFKMALLMPNRKRWWLKYLKMWWVGFVYCIWWTKILNVQKSTQDSKTSCIFMILAGFKESY